MNLEVMSDVQIRPAMATDLSRLMGMDHTCNSDYVWQLDLQKNDGQIVVTLREVRLPHAIRVPYPRDVFSLADEWNHGSQMLVASLDGEPVGYIRLLEQVASECVWVTDLAVSPETRRMGIASALVQAAQTWAEERGHRQLFLEMQSKNHAAVRLAQKMGFEFCGYNDHYYATQDVALFFGRILK